MNCFLIDNDQDDQEIFSMALQEVDESISCMIAPNGVIALQVLDADPSYLPSFIFIDMNMPLMNGKQCLQEIRKRERFKKVPVYMYSTASDPYSIEEVKQMGAEGFIVKPPSFSGLVELLSGILRPGNSQK